MFYTPFYLPTAISASLDNHLGYYFLLDTILIPPVILGAAIPGPHILYHIVSPSGLSFDNYSSNYISHYSLFLVLIKVLGFWALPPIFAFPPIFPLVFFGVPYKIHCFNKKCMGLL